MKLHRRTSHVTPGTSAFQMGVGKVFDENQRNAVKKKKKKKGKTDEEKEKKIEEKKK